jgi:hypothetical protein
LLSELDVHATALDENSNFGMAGLDSQTLRFDANIVPELLLFNPELTVPLLFDNQTPRFDAKFGLNAMLDITLQVNVALNGCMTSVVLIALRLR